jgi:hypothetical protein
MVVMELQVKVIMEGAGIIMQALQVAEVAQEPQDLTILVTQEELVA